MVKNSVKQHKKLYFFPRVWKTRVSCPDNDVQHFLYAHVGMPSVLLRFIWSLLSQYSNCEGGSESTPDNFFKLCREFYLSLLITLQQ